MKQLFRTLAIASLLSAVPAVAAPSRSDIHQAELAVATQKRALLTAQKSGDAVSIATARAKLRAAQARAWGRRHPAPAPTIAIR